MDTEATREEMSEARLPHAYRDSCAHLLIPLNKCRKATWYAPWKCEVRRATGLQSGRANGLSWLWRRNADMESGRET